MQLAVVARLLVQRCHGMYKVKSFAAVTTVWCAVSGFLDGSLALDSRNAQTWTIKVVMMMMMMNGGIMR